MRSDNILNKISSRLKKLEGLWKEMNHAWWNALYQQALLQTWCRIWTLWKSLSKWGIGKRKRNATSSFNFRSFTPSLTKTYDLMWCCALLITCVQIIVIATCHYSTGYSESLSNESSFSKLERTGCCLSKIPGEEQIGEHRFSRCIICATCQIVWGQRPSRSSASWS